MSKWIQSCAGLLMTGVLLGASAQTSADHEQHHPGGSGSGSGATNVQAAPAPSPGALPAGSGGMMAMMPGMDQHMKAMQDMHARMVAAKTPAERQALMPEQTKLMQQGMGMMQGMGGGMEADMGARMQMMEKRMDMMQSMMQGVMDRLAPPAP